MQNNFDRMGGVLVRDPDSGLEVRAGQIFEGKTVKGHTNLIVTMRVLNGHMYYAHGDKVRKVPIDTFMKAVSYGDLQPRSAKEIDTERLSQATIGLDAIANRRTLEEHIDFMGEGAEERYMQHKA